MSGVPKWMMDEATAGGPGFDRQRDAELKEKKGIDFEQFRNHEVCLALTRVASNALVLAARAASSLP